MKNLWKKVMVFLLAAVVITAGTGLKAFAAGNQVTIHVKDGAKWGSMNVYNWGDDGETAGVWPGTAMEEEGDGWYTYTFDTKVNLNLVFSAKPGTPQSGNINDLSKDGKEYWIVVGGEAADNDMGVSGVAAVLHTEPEEGWPVLATPAAESSKTDKAAETSDVPKTGETFSVVPMILMAGAVVVFSITSIQGRKKRA